MRAGELRERVTIQSKSVARNTFGEEVVTWTTVTTVWAAVEPLSGREYLAAQQATATLDMRVRIRYVSGIVPEMRVLYGSRVFEIKSVINVSERDREVQLMCLEIQP